LNRLLPGVSKPIRGALAAFSMAMALARHCHSGRVAACMPGTAAPASSRRRLERLLANPRLDGQAVTAGLVRSLSGAWPGRRWVLIIDETDRGERLRSLQILLAYKRRAIPLAVRAYRPSFGGGRRPRLLFRLLALIRRSLPPGMDVTVLADRGLAWPALVRFRDASGWHYVLRVQGQTSVWPDGHAAPRRADTLVPRRRGVAFSCRARVFKASGWLDCYFTALHDKRAGEPGLLASGRPGASRHFRRYGQRAWCEEAFRDQKSGGFAWRQSHVDDPAHATRLLVVMLLAMLLCLAVGAQVVKHGLRRLLDPHRKRLLSYFQLGLRWLAQHFVTGAPPTLPMSLVPP
jgi:hypothetical protein